MPFCSLNARSHRTRRGLCRLALVTCLLAASPAWLPAGAQEAQSTPQMIDVGGLKLRALITGQAREGQPTVVLVGALGDSLDEAWPLVQPAVAQFARVVAYDRAGLGKSEPDSAPPTPRRVAAQLHALLQNAGIKPPYVLVGHSLGGPYVRMFAGLYPGEVAGLVFVDPTDFTATRAEQLALWTELGAGESGMNGIEKQMEQQFAGSAPAIRAEAEVYLQLQRSGWEDFRSLPPFPQVPIVILMAGKVDVPPAVKAVMGKHRILTFMKWASEAPDATLVATTRSGHYIQASEPELVTWAIRRALEPAR